jgi:hypothetical protein
MKEYLGALWDRFFQPILVVIDVLGFFSILCIVVDDNYEFIALLVLGVAWFASGFCLFRKQRERIVELETSLANERDSVDVVLTMLMQEIDQNLEEFTGFWNKIRQTEKPSQESPLALATRFAEFGPPNLRCLVWEKQDRVLTKGLTNEQLGQVQSFYGRLSKVISLHSTLRDLLYEQQSYLKAGTLPQGHVWGVVGPPTPFQDAAPSLWDDLVQLALELIEGGNPLRDQAHDE